MPWAVAGAAVAAGGAYLAADKQADAAKDASRSAEFRPFNVFTNDAKATFNPNGAATVQTHGAMQTIRQGLLSNSSRGFLNADPNSQFLMQAGQSDFVNALNQSNNVRTATPGSAARSEQELRSIAGQQGRLGRQGINAAFNSPTAAGLTGVATSGGQRFLNGGLQGPSASGLGTFAGQQAQSLLSGGRPQSFNQIAGERLSALRTAARPSEERAVDSKVNSLFSSGRLGTTGGARNLSELALQQEIADQNRIINSQDFANSQQNQERAFFLNQQGLGSQYLGQAMQAVGQDQQALQAQRGLGSNLLSQAFGGVGMDQARAANLGSLGTNLFNSQAQTQAAAVAAAQAGDASRFSTADRRLQGAQALFNFGQAQDDRTFNRSLQGLGVVQGIDSNSLDLARFGASVGQAQSSANANAGALAMRGANGGIGTALQGFGTGLTNLTPEQTNNLNSTFAGIFGR